MSKLSVTLNKTVDIYDYESSCVKLCLSVIKTEGVPAEIFVHRYSPLKNTYTFQHTAYYDEMQNTPDSVVNKNAVSDIRLGSLTYTAQTLEKVDEFVDGVCGDIKRLLTQYRVFGDNAADSTEVIVVTDKQVNAFEDVEDGFTMGGVEVEL